MTAERFERYKDALRRGHVAALRDRHGEAIDAYEEAAELAPERALPHASIGRILIKLERPNEALAAFGRALDRAPADETALAGRGEVLVGLERRVEAAEVFVRLAEAQATAGKLAEATDAARQALDLDQVLFIPAHDSPLRGAEPYAAGFHRFAMVALAINGHAGYQVSDLELTREGRSYTIDTLRELQTQGWPPSQLHFIVGADAFAEIARWRGYPEILDTARFVVISRPGTPLASAVPPELRGDPRVMSVDAHTRDVSSTVIRARLEAGRPIDDLVPRAVARHIVAHKLYDSCWSTDREAVSPKL